MENDEIFECVACGANYQDNRSLRRHTKQKHGDALELEDSSDPKKLARCLEANCGSAFRTRPELRSHLAKKHSFTLLEIEKEFETEQQFLVWKNSIENCTHSSFVARHGRKDTGKGVVYKYYDCNRSGKHSPRDQEHSVSKKRRVSESAKIGTLCPAQLTVHIESSKVSVRCSISHYGHELSLKDIRIPRLELESIKGRILEGVTLDRILAVSIVRLIDLFLKRKHF